MGVHQYHIALLPRSRFESKIPTTLTEADVDEGQNVKKGWWAKCQPSQNALIRLRSLFPNNQSWGETEEFVSTGGCGSDLRIWKTDERVWEIELRFSPSLDNWHIMEEFLKVAREEKCLIREHRTGAVLEPNDETVRKRMDGSLAMLFVSNPADAIVQAAKETHIRTGK